MVGGESCTLSLCVYSAELDAAANGAYCKIYVDANDRTNGSSSSGAASSSSSYDTATHSPDPSQRSSDSAIPSRSFHTHVEKSEKKTYLPTWNETFTIDIFDRRHEILTIRLKSKKLLHVSVVGACAIPLHQIPTGRPVDQWFPVQKGGKRRGKLRLQMMITYPPSSAGLRTSVGTPQQRPSSFSHHRNGSPETRRSMDQRSSGGSGSLHQRPSSLSSRPSDPNYPNGALGRYAQAAAPSEPTGQHQQQQQQPTLANYGYYEPEDEPSKDKSPLKVDAYEIYRPATTPRLDSESDDDDEASFPRVAELHRLESDLIGESSDEEVDTTTLVPKSPLYLEPLTEGSGSPSDTGSAGRASSARGSHAAAAAVYDEEESLTLDDFKPLSVATDAKPAGGGRRSSVEITRHTTVAVAKEDLDHMLELSAVTASSFDDVEEGIDMSGIAGGSDDELYQPRSPSQGSRASDVVVGEVVAAEVTQGVWNRYSSSSSEELQLPYPDEDVEVARSSVSSGSVHQGIAVSIHEANMFVEPGSPSHSSGGSVEETEGKQQRFEDATTPRDSISTDGGDQHEFFGGDDRTSPSTPPRKTSSPRASLVGETVDSVSPSRVRHDSSPRNSWVSDDTHVAREASVSRSSWVSEDVEQTPVRMSGRDKSWSGTSWVSEQDDVRITGIGHKESSSPRSSWISEHSEAHGGDATSPRRSGRDKSWSGTSWVSEHDATSAEAANDHSSPRHSWVSEKSEATARHSWVSDKSEATTSSAPSPAPPARLTGRDKSWSGTSWINENDSTSFVDASGPRSSWISEDDNSHVGEAASPRHSWVSDAASEAPSRLTGRDKSWSGTSWISEPDSSSFVDASGPPTSSSPRSSWISEGDEQEVNPDTFDRSAETSSRTSWIHEDGAVPPPRLTGRDKSWSGTSWISEHDNTSFVDATGLRSSWISDGDEADLADVASPRHSWVSEGVSEAPARLTGRDKSWSGTSWISEQDNRSSMDASASHQAESSRTSWISEQPDEAVEHSEPRHSWVSDAATDVPPARLTGRDKSWSGTSWISEPDNTSFVDATGPPPVGSPRSSWISEDVDIDAHDSVSPRHSWVSESVADASPARLTGRDKSWSGTSWVSEHDHTSFVDASGPPATASPRNSWISEADSPAAASLSRTSWVSEHDATRREEEASPRSSWVSEEATEAVQAAASSESRTSWVPESAPSEASRRPSSPRTSWISEAATHKDETTHHGSPRNSWVSEEPDAAAQDRRRVSSSTSWVNEATHANSFVDASQPRHSFVSDGSVEDDAEPVTVDAGVAILPAPVRDSIDAMSPARASFLSEISDIIEAEHDVSPRSSVSADPTSQNNTFVSTSSSVETVERQDQESGSVEAVVIRASYSSDVDSRHAHVNVETTTPRASVSSEHSRSMEEDTASTARISFESEARTTETRVDTDVATPRALPSAVVGADAAVPLSTGRRQSRSSDEGRSSGYDGDNMETSTTRSSSLFSDQARDHHVDDSLDVAARRRSSSSSSGSGGGAYGASPYTESYTDLTRHSSLSSAGIDTVVDRDDAEKHAEAVAEAARYSSSSEGEFDHEDHADLPHALPIHVAATATRTTRRYSSASDDDTVDRSSSAVGVDYDDFSTAGRSHSSSTAARDEAQFAAWTEESSTSGDFMDAMRRVSQTSALSDMYDASPRTSDLGIIPEAQASRVSVESHSSSVSLDEASADSATDMRRFISSVNVFVEPYDDESPRSSISNDMAVADAAREPEEPVKVTVTVERPHDDTKPASVNPFIEYGSPRSSSSSEAEFLDEVHGIHHASTRSSHSSEGDHEVVVVETFDQLAGPVASSSVADDETIAVKSSRVSSVASDRLGLDTLLATREYVEDDDTNDASPLSPLSSLSSATSPHAVAMDDMVSTAALLDDAARQCETVDTDTVALARPSAASVESAAASETNSSSSAPKVRFSIEHEDETKTDDAALGSTLPSSGVRQNVRGDHVLVNMASSLTRAQLQAVAQDYLPSDDSESESDDYDSDADLNFDSD